MTTRFLIALLSVLALASPAFAHRLNEYLQATTVEVDHDHITLRMRLTPGVDVLSKVLETIDIDRNGLISEAEQARYAELLRHDLSVTLDTHPLTLRRISSTFPKLEDMKNGLGDILITFDASTPPGPINRKLTLENHHQNAISVYLVNCLIPQDPTIHVIAQNRNLDQSIYQLNYTQSVLSTASATAAPNVPNWLDKSGSASLFKAFFYQGVHHILTGYDHLLFVGAPLLAARTLWDLVKVVSAFTLAHTITLTLAALNVIHLPTQIVEPLIAASIVFVAAQNLFWPSHTRGWSRLAAAFFFGLFHGLGFAGGLLEAMREMQGGTMFLAISAFSIGVEAGHQLVVIPLFSLLKWGRHVQPNTVARTRFSMALQRFGSAGISLAGLYYLCLAIAGTA